MKQVFLSTFNRLGEPVSLQMTGGAISRRFWPIGLLCWPESAGTVSHESSSLLRAVRVLRGSLARGTRNKGRQTRREFMEGTRNTRSSLM